MSDRLLFMLSKTQNTLTAHFKRELKKENLDLSPGQMGILLALLGDRQMTMGHLSQILESDNAAVTRLVDKLEKKALVVRSINPEDRRQMLVAVTDEGLAAASVVRRIARKANDRIKDGFSEKEMDVFSKINRAIVTKFVP